MRKVDEQFASTFSKYKRRSKKIYSEITDETGLSAPYLCDILHGRKAVNLETALKISKSLGFSLDDMKGLV